jgi:hypothetical protein
MKIKNITNEYYTCSKQQHETKQNKEEWVRSKDFGMTTENCTLALYEKINIESSEHSGPLSFYSHMHNTSI